MLRAQCIEEKAANLRGGCLFFDALCSQHYISFIAYVTTDRMQLVKLYPEGNAQTRLQLRGRGVVYFYCNRHGLFKRKI